MKAIKPGQYIHSILLSLPTIQDGDISFILSVDNYSEFCFQPSMTKGLTIIDIEKHIISLLKEIKKSHPGVKPKIFMSYADDFIDQLSSKFIKQCTLEYNPKVAEKIALPVARSFIADNRFNPINN